MSAYYSQATFILIASKFSVQMLETCGPKRTFCRLLYYTGLLALVYSSCDLFASSHSTTERAISCVLVAIVGALFTYTSATANLAPNRKGAP